MPKMGESIEEATITNWFVKEGDRVEEDDVLLEIATDKVDSEIPSPVEGIVKKILFKQDEVVAVGTVIALIDLNGESTSTDQEVPESVPEQQKMVEQQNKEEQQNTEEQASTHEITSSGERFYSPLVRRIAREEKISQAELDSISGSGLNGRVQKNDVINYLENRGEAKPVSSPRTQETKAAPAKAPAKK